MAQDWLSKAAVAKATLNGRAGEVPEDEFSQRHPALFAFMTQLQHGEEPRELCKLQIFADGEVWKAALHDPNAEASLFVTCKKPQDAFQLIEKALQVDKPDWRFWRRAVTKKRRGS